MVEETPASFKDLIAFAETYLDAYGSESASGVGWTRGDADTRYRVMVELVRGGQATSSLLDFGCGLSHLYDFILREGRRDLLYSGLDLSDRYLAASRERYPEVDYYQVDVLAADAPALPDFDYVVMNGIWNYRGSRSNEEMWTYLTELVRMMFRHARVGLAFNVITTHVDWQRDDLFHVPVDDVLTFLSREISRHLVVRHDYGLYEYTVYVYRHPSDPQRVEAKSLVQPRPPDRAP